MSGNADSASAEAAAREARRLGFELVGFTSPDSPAHFDAFQEWIQQGFHGEMAYLAAERSVQRRADPRQILPGCRSILVLGARYQPSYSHITHDDRKNETYQENTRRHGRIASYAWGDDYHDLFPPRMEKLVEFIEGEAGRPIAHRCYTDSGPMLECDLAQRAGLGWIGKNTCLINPALGSYFFLAEILLELELPHDTPFLYDRCGKCTRCLEACPTGCILPPVLFRSGKGEKGNQSDD